MAHFVREIKKFADLELQWKADAFLAKINRDLIKSGKAILTFRSDEATVSYTGNQLCHLSAANDFEPSVYNRYLPITRSRVMEACPNYKKENYTERRWQIDIDHFKVGFSTVFSEITDNIEKDGSPESVQASRFYRFSPLNDAEQHEIVLLDVEAAFAASDEKTERIDLVFYHTGERQLFFAEVKRLSDPRIKIKKTPGGITASCQKVEKQLSAYRDLIERDKANIIKQYNNVIGYYNALSGAACPLPLMPEDASPRLGLLLVEYAANDHAALGAVKAEIKKSGHGVYAIGNTANASDKTLAAIYKAFQ